MSKPKNKESKAAPKVTPEEKPLEETNIPMVDHVVTEEDLKNNPELVGQVEVGDVIQIPADEAEVSPEESVESEATPDQETDEEAPEEPKDEEDTKPEEKPLEEENEAPEEKPAEAELVAPSWCDPRLWASLSTERKQQLIRGENFRV